MLSYFRSQTQEEIIEKDRQKQKIQRIMTATMDEKHRKPNPQNGILFPEENFIKFTVQGCNSTLKLNTYRFKPQDRINPKALVFLFHGLTSHMNHGAHIAKYLADIGCIVIAFDHRGHGKSEGLFGLFGDLEDHLSDSNDFIDRVIKEYEHLKLPVFLAGLSMGGMTSFRLAVQNPNKYRGIIMFAPAIKTNVSSRFLRMVSVIGYIFPETAFFARRANINTKNPQVSESYAEDNLIYKGKSRLGTSRTILGTMKESRDMIPQLKTPWLLIQGGLDKLVDPDVRFDLEKLSPSIDKTVLYYENCWHDVWHEEEILEALPKIAQWIKDRY